MKICGRENKSVPNCAHKTHIRTSQGRHRMYLKYEGTKEMVKDANKAHNSAKSSHLICEKNEDSNNDNENIRTEKGNPFT